MVKDDFLYQLFMRSRFTLPVFTYDFNFLLPAMELPGNIITFLTIGSQCLRLKLIFSHRMQSQSMLNFSAC